MLKVLKENFAEQGLTGEEVINSRDQFGKNKLPEAPKPSLITQFINQFNNLLIIILIVAAVISAFFGEVTDTIAIIMIVILNAILGVSQERRAEKALEAVKKLASPTSKVIRGGKLEVINSEDVVVGDLLVLEAGDKISCDGSILEERGLTIDESTLTGESVSVSKSSIKKDDKSAEEERRFQRSKSAEEGCGLQKINLLKKSADSRGIKDFSEENRVFMGTAVTKGRAKAIVTEIGINTKLGIIATKIREARKEKTPLEIQLDSLGKLLGIIFLAVCGVIFVLGLLKGSQASEMFLTSISLAVAAIPEGLPAVVTIVLAIGVAEIAQKNAVVRNLPAVETLGAVTHICTDKTGTLTQNKMTLVEISSDKGVLKDTELNAKNVPLELTRAMVLCNDATLESGDPTEIALVNWLGERHINDIRKKFPRIYEIPFTSENKRMSTVHNYSGEYLVVSKGAIEVIVEHCSTELIKGEPKTLNMKRKEEILSLAEARASKGLRVLALAEKHLDHEPENDEDVEKNLTFLGLVFLKDPLRPEVKDAVDRARSAGIRPIMITGDHQITAYSIARELDFPEGRVITSAELNEISDENLSNIIESVSVFARINPLDKLRIVYALQKKKEIVAMTGDGVNDAPALKKSDIGVAMGKTGTEVAKEASDIVLMDDNFATLVDAVFRGRTIYENMRKFIVYLLSCNIGEVLVMFFAIILGYPVPLLPLQLLWLNLVTDSFPALALGMEEGEPKLMNKPPRGKNEPILTKYHYGIIITQSIAITAATLAGFLIALKRTGNVNEARTIAYMTLVLSELFRAFSARSFEGYIFKMGVFSNKFLTYSTIGGIALLFASVYIKPFAMLFKNVDPTPTEFFYIIILSLVPFFISEIFKTIRPED